MIDILIGLSYCLLRTGNLFQYIDFLTFSSSFTVLNFTILAHITPILSITTGRNIGWRYSKKEFKKFYTKLHLSGLIGDTNYELFSSHFFGGQTPLQPIRWHGRYIELIKLFSKLMTEGVIMNHTNFIRIALLHFSDQNGNPLKYGTLKTSNGRNEKNLFDNFTTDLINEIKNGKGMNEELKIVNSRNS